MKRSWHRSRTTIICRRFSGSQDGNSQQRAQSGATRLTDGTAFAVSREGGVTQA